jgi:hypothetical protein
MHQLLIKVTESKSLLEFDFLVYELGAKKMTPLSWELHLLVFTMRFAMQ